MNQLAKPGGQGGSRDLKPIDEFRGGLNRMDEQLGMALPRHVDVDRFKRIAVTAVQQNPDLLKANRSSLFGACVTAAQLGLVTDGVLGQAYLVPYKGKVQLIPGYKGLLTLVRQSGEISSIDVDTIHKNDKVDYVMGDDSRLTIRPNWTDRGAIIGAYAIARFKDGGIQRALMTKEEIEAIRKASPSANSPAWKNHYGEMAKKTVFRRLCKMLPLSTEAQAAAAIADVADAGRVASLDHGIVVIDEPAPAIDESQDQEKPKRRRKSKPAAEENPPHDAETGEIIEGEVEVVDDQSTVGEDPSSGDDHSTAGEDPSSDDGDFF
jgi:recombination protein RecT